MLGHNSADLTDENHNVLQFFDDSELTFYHSLHNVHALGNADTDLITWLVDLLKTFDPCTIATSSHPLPPLSNSFSPYHTSFFAPESFDDLTGIMNFHASSSCAFHFLLLTAASKTICNASWLSNIG